MTTLLAERLATFCSLSMYVSAPASVEARDEPSNSSRNLRHRSARAGGRGGTAWRRARNHVRKGVPARAGAAGGAAQPSCRGHLLAHEGAAITVRPWLRRSLANRPRRGPHAHPFARQRRQKEASARSCSQAPPPRRSLAWRVWLAPGIVPAGAAGESAPCREGRRGPARRTNEPHTAQWFSCAALARAKTLWNAAARSNAPRAARVHRLTLVIFVRGHFRCCGRHGELLSTVARVVVVGWLERSRGLQCGSWALQISPRPFFGQIFDRFPPFRKWCMSGTYCEYLVLKLCSYLVIAVPSRRGLHVSHPYTISFQS